MNIFKIGHTYIDDIANSREKDQFVKWIPGMGNSKGIRPVRYKKIKTEVPAFIVLLTRQSVHRHFNPWDDIVDYLNGSIYYWGDAKFNTEKSFNEFEGNKVLLKSFETYLDGNYNMVPPILHFSKTNKGKVKFNGLCVIEKLSLTYYEDNGKPVKNYRCELAILDQETVNMDWLNERVNACDFNLNNTQQPRAWSEYIKGRVRRIDVFKKDIKSKTSQLPSNNNEVEILNTLCNLTPLQFEAAVVEIFRELPLVHHNITRTRLCKDGGFDFAGEFSLPFPLEYKIKFLGEVKKYNSNNSVGPGQVSRLVARLGRGEYGIFVTTSYYTKQAQEEALKDAYPIKLYSGTDIINFLRDLRLIDNGKIKKEWLDVILNITK